MKKDTIGVDISKATFDVYRLSDGNTGRFENSERGFRQFIKWLPKGGLERIVYEATGSYHKAFEKTLAHSHPLVMVNPLQARRFAEARGTRVKTDAVDARMLAMMGDAFDLQPQAPKTKEALVLKELYAARQALSKERTRLLNRQKTATLPILKRQHKAQLKHIQQQIKEIDEEIAKVLQDNDDLADRYRILCSIPGLGQVSAAALITHMPELGSIDRKKVASLAGVAPFTKQSGQWTGKANIRGGRKALRDALYMPALVAARFNPDMKKQYRRMIEAGKPAKVAIVAIMRKLIELANTLLKSRNPWVQKTA